MMLEFLLLLLSLLIRLLLLLVPTLMLMLIFATAAACSCFFRYWVNMTSSENQHHFPNGERKYIEIATTLSLRLIQPLSACFCSEFSLFCFVPTFIYMYIPPATTHRFCFDVAIKLIIIIVYTPYSISLAVSTMEKDTLIITDNTDL